MTAWTPEIVRGLPPAAAKGQVVAFDFEIFHQGERLHIPDGSLACLALASPAWGNTVYLVEDIPDVRRALQRVARATLAAHHSLYDLRYGSKFGFDIHVLRVWDTEIAAKILTSGLYLEYGLNDLARRSFDLYLDKSIRERFANATHLTDDDRAYAAKDALVTVALAVEQMAAMGDEMTRYYWTVEEPALHAMLDMRPVPVDEHYWMLLAQEMEAKRDQLTEALGFNPVSPDQCLAALKRAGIKASNTRAETLELIGTHPLVRGIIAARTAATNASRYGQKWLADYVGPNGVVTDYHPFRAVTGRWASKDPNLQNIPVREEPRYRYAFPARRGCKRLKMDASQQEPRVLAFLSKEPKLIQVFQAGGSSHLLVGREIFNDPDLSKDDKHRYNLAKIINLGVSYDMSAGGVSRQAGISTDEAEQFIRRYFARFPFVARWKQRMEIMVSQVGYIRTPTGRPIHINRDAPNSDALSSNYPIQGGAAEITKLSVSRIWSKCAEAGLEFSVDLVVHDETVAMPKTKDVKRMTKLMEAAWLEAADYVIPGIPFAVEAQVGATWGGNPPEE